MYALRDLENLTATVLGVEGKATRVAGNMVPCRTYRRVVLCGSTAFLYSMNVDPPFLAFVWVMHSADLPLEAVLPDQKRMARVSLLLLHRAGDISASIRRNMEL